MTKFVQIHMLVSYPPSNLNRDDLGRPKTAVMGGTQRLRVSSQSLKRAWRTSEVFSNYFDSSKSSIRTKKLGVFIFESLTKGIEFTNLLYNMDPHSSRNKIDEETAKQITSNLLLLYAKQEKTTVKELEVNPLKEYETAQLCTLSMDEVHRLNECLKQVTENKGEVTALLSEKYSDDKSKNKLKKEIQKKLELLSNTKTAVDIAMYGRMLTTYPSYNVEAAVQVSHAITANEVAVEDDFFTAVDDLNRGEEDMGSGHLGETEFASGLFYIYACVDCELLKSNLGDKDLADKALRALVEAMAKVSPTGKQNSFASRAYASYMMIEKGKQQPRSLSVSYLEPIRGRSMLKSAIDALTQTNKNMEDVYGKCCEESMDMNAYTGKGSLDKMLEFVVN